MQSKLILVVSCIAIAAAPAAAAGAQAAPTKNQGAEAAKSEKKYCLTVQPLTGSRVEKTECKTKRQWAWEGIKVDQLSK